MQVEIEVDSRIRVPKNVLTAIEVIRMRALFEYPNTKKASLQHLMRNKPWLWNKLPDTEASWRQTATHETFPRGGMLRVMSVLESAGHEVVVQDKMVLRPHEHGELRRVLWPHQREAVLACMQGRQGIIRAATGSGKTSSMLGLAVAAGQTCLVGMNSVKLMEQWRKRAKEELGLNERDIGEIGGGHNSVRPFTLAVVHSLTKRMADPGFASQWGMVMVDEVHLAAANMFQTCVDAFPAVYRVGASADQRRKDKREYLIHDAFGDVLHDASSQRMIDEKRVLDVDVRLHRTGFAAPWYGTAERASDDVAYDPNAEAKHVDFNRLVAEMAADEQRNAKAVAVAYAEAHSGESVLMFVHHRAHAEGLVRMLARMGLNAGLLLGGPGSSPEYDRSLRGLADGSIKVGVGTYQAVGTGMDIPRLSVGIAVTPCLSNRTIFQQARGRLCRVADGKTRAVFHVLWDAAVFPSAPKRALEYNGHAHVEDLAGTWELTTTKRRR